MMGSENVKTMLIALDYDGTYTADPELWLLFINQAQKHGHTIICATMRSPQEGVDICMKLQSKVEIIYTARKAKRLALESRSIFPDIWIDDSPDWLFHDAG